MAGSRWQPLEAAKPPWSVRPRPQWVGEVPSLQDRKALQAKREMLAREVFEKESKANRLNRDGEATEIKPVPNLQAPKEPLQSVEALRKELLSLVGEIPQMAHIEGKESDGPYMICPNSYDRGNNTVEVLRASDLRQQQRVPRNKTKYIQIGFNSGGTTGI